MNSFAEITYRFGMLAVIVLHYALRSNFSPWKRTMFFANNIMAKGAKALAEGC